MRKFNVPVRIVETALFFIFSNCYTLAQTVAVDAVIDSSEILIGDQVKLTLSAEYPKGTTIEWPIIGDTITNHIEVIEAGKRDTVASVTGESEIIIQTYTITSFDSGFWTIPPFCFHYKNDTQVIAQTDPVLLIVQTVQVDTTDAIKDIKPPIDTPVTFEELTPYFLIAAAAIILVLLIIYILKKMKKKPVKPILIYEKQEPAHITAIKNLDLLKEKKLWQQSKIKLYHSELTDIIRVYIENRFAIKAMELTSEETISCFRYVDIPDEAKNKLRQIFMLADMVKFARANPIASEHELSLQNAYNFVHTTKPEQAI